ncbi:MAG: hypothetical protein RIT45_2771 [Pseudomonadota bacterium]
MSQATSESATTHRLASDGHVRLTDPIAWVAAELLGTAALGGDDPLSAPALAMLAAGGLGFGSYRADDGRWWVSGRPHWHDDLALLRAVAPSLRPDLALERALRNGDVLAAEERPRLCWIAARTIEALGLPEADASAMPVVLLHAFSDIAAVRVLGRTIRLHRDRLIAALRPDAGDGCATFVANPPPAPRQFVEGLRAVLERCANQWALSRAPSDGPAGWLDAARHLGAIAEQASDPAAGADALLALLRAAGLERGDGALHRGLFADGLLEASRLLQDHAVKDRALAFATHAGAVSAFRVGLLPVGPEAATLWDAEDALALAIVRGGHPDRVFLARERVREARDAARAHLVGLGVEAIAARLEDAAIGLLGLLREERKLVQSLAETVGGGA